MTKGPFDSKQMRVNHQIRISPIRVIDQDENQLGVIETNEARRLAQEAGLDLVEVAPTARPPVCRIMDYGKWKYEQKKKEQKAKVHRHETQVKEVRMRPKTDPHDQQIKVNRAKDFLAKGDKVQFTMLFRGREMVHLDRGRDSFNNIKQSLADVAKVERDFKLEGRRMTMVLAPLTSKDLKVVETAVKAKEPAGEKPAAGQKPQPPAGQPQRQAAPPQPNQPAPQEAPSQPEPQG